MRPAGEKASLGWRGPTLHAENAGDVDLLAAKMSDQRVPSGVIANGGDGEDARAERSEGVGGGGSAAPNDVRFAMLWDQDRRLARDAGDFTVPGFIGNKIAPE